MFYYKRLIPLLLFLCLLLTACSAPSAEYDSNGKNMPMEQAKQSNLEAVNRDSKAAPTVKKANSLPQERKIIYTGEIRGRVDHVSKAVDQVGQIAKQQEAYITTSNSYHSDDGKTHRITYRIPQPKLQIFLDQVKKLFIEEPAVSLKASDVTEEFVDLESRQKAKEAVRNRLYDLMKQAKATSDLLTISQQLDQIETELEQIKGRKNYLNNQIAYSTLEIELTEKATPGSTSNQPYTKELWSTFTSSWVQFYEGIQVLFLLFVSLIPTLLFLTLVGFTIYLTWKKRIEKKRTLHNPTNSDKI